MSDSKKKKSKGRSKNDSPRTHEKGKELTADELDNVAGGKAAGSLDAGVFFKYDLKAQKEG